MGPHEARYIARLEQDAKERLGGQDMSNLGMGLGLGFGMWLSVIVNVLLEPTLAGAILVGAVCGLGCTLAGGIIGKWCVGWAAWKREKELRGQLDRRHHNIRRPF